MSISRAAFVAAAGCAFLCGAIEAAGAQARPGRLVVTVLDQSGAVIPKASVTVTSEDESTRPDEPRTVLTSPVGIATFDGLVPGRYTIRAEFPGFQPVVVNECRVRSGTNRQSVVLPIEKIDEKLTVERDKQADALDPRGAAFSTVLTREQIEALPDDPEEMEKVLKAMAPPGSTIRVDGFTGGQLPPKSQIRSIRLPRMDMMAAQNHGGMAGMQFIDIMTQPGAGPLRGGIDFTMRNDSLNARNPFAEEKGDEGLHRYGLSLSGTIRPNRSSFAVTAQRTGQHDTGNLLAALPGGTRAEPVRQPSNTLRFTGRYDQAVGRDRTLRASLQHSSSERSNLGVGGYNLPERAYSASATDTLFRISENGPVGRRFFWESRLQIHAFGSDARSTVEAPAVRVLDSFTSGGAQQAGGSRAVEFELASDLDYVRGVHSVRTGILVEGGRYRSDQASNYLGTFTFTSMEDYLTGRPRLYTRRIGDPLVRYSNLQVGLYVQDDYRVRRSVMLSLGLRYEAQTISSDHDNFSPRASLTWSPFKSGSTTFRASAGFFSDWLDTSTYRQVLQVDGFRQRELQVLEPAYPDPGLPGETPPANRYLLGEATSLPSSMAASAGVDRQLAGGLRLSATYTCRRGWGLLRGANLNAPVEGVRPDPAFANIVEVQSDASSRSHTLNLSATMLMLNWHRTLLAANYSFTRAESNTTGPFGLPASGGTLETEWGPTLPRHRFGGQFSTEIAAGLGLSLSARAQSGSPYDVTTGIDANRDGVFNDRPAGVGRNSAWTPWQWDVGARLSYTIGFGERPQGSGAGPTGVMVAIGGSGGGMPAGGIAVRGGANDKRYRIEFYAAAQNVTNHPNYIGYSGVMTSPFFGRPTTVMNPRKVEVGARFGF